MPSISVCQRNDYEYILRDDEENREIHLYITANPANWVDDGENPAKKPVRIQFMVERRKGGSKVYCI